MLKVLSFFFIYFVYWWLMKQVLERFDAQCSELFLYWQIQIYNETEVNRRFRCSMFWVFSLWDSICNLSNGKTAGFDAQCFELFLYYRLDFYDTILRCKKFRRSTFWAFSLYSSCRWRRQFSSCFDAQCSELFLYELIEYASAYGFFGFDAQCSELFLYNL